MPEKGEFCIQKMNKKSKKAKRQRKRLRTIRKNCIVKNEEKIVFYVKLVQFTQRTAYFRSFIQMIVPCMSVPSSKMTKRHTIFMFFCIFPFFCHLCTFSALFYIFLKKLSFCFHTLELQCYYYFHIL